jgi:hypothetical protein
MIDGFGTLFPQLTVSHRNGSAAGGPPDLIVEGDAARPVRRQSDSIVERPPPGLPGYEGRGDPIGEDE